MSDAFIQITDISLNQLLDNAAVEQPSAEAVQQFELALEGGTPDNVGLEHQILDGISSLKSDIDSAKADFSRSLAVDDLSDPAALLEVQWAMMRVGLQLEMVAKTAGRNNQNIDTMLRAQ